MYLISVVLSFNLITFLSVIFSQETTGTKHLKKMEHYNQYKHKTNLNERVEAYENNSLKKLPKELQSVKKICDKMKLKQTVSPKIVSGTIVPAGEPNLYPWMAALFLEDFIINGSKNYPETVYVCGGSLISASYVITAGHCIATLKVKPNKLIVRLGNKDLSSRKSLDFRLQKVILHPHYTYNRTHMLNDIALLKFPRPVKFTKCIQPICIPSLTIQWEPIKMGQPVMLAGWGKVTGGGGSRAVVNLRHGISNVVETYICFKKLSPPLINKNFTYCINKIQQTDSASCVGDSGSPIIPIDLSKKVELPILLGIISFGHSNCLGTAYTTKVDPFHEWIRKVIAKESDC